MPKVVKTVMLEDGDDLIVMSRIQPPNAFDPMHTYGSIVRMYRVVSAASAEPILELVPMMKSGKLVTLIDTVRKEKEISA